MDTFKAKFITCSYYIYAFTVLAAAVYGASCGIEEWLRKDMFHYTLTIKAVEPIVNIAINAAHLAYQIFVNAVISGAVAVTAPVSVPLLVHFASAKAN